MTLNNKKCLSPNTYILLLLLLLASISSINSQTNATAPSSNQLASELHKESNQNISDLVYLQTSKGIYETEEELWFKAYILDSQHFIPTLRSAILFVQLVNDSTNTVVCKEKYEINNGFVDGHLNLHDSLPKGSYSLSAYSSHSFYKNTKEFHAIRKLKIVKKIVTKQANIIAVKDSIFSFNTYVEGGNLVSGIQTKVGFKALTTKGLPKQVSGTLYENKKPIIEFKSMHAGMGCFIFTPDASKQYYIQLSNSSDAKRYNLPTIFKNGKTLALLRNTKNKISLKISQNEGLPEEKVYLRLQIRGIVHNLATGQLKKDLFITIPTTNLPQGIAEVTLFNKELEPIAERLVYINQDKKLYIQAHLEKEAYKTREKVTVNLKVTDEKGAPVIGHLGLSVYDAFYKNQADSKTIESHYQLSTQLKGQLYNPSYYFNTENKNRKQALNLLLLTQGWRRYIWQKDNLKDHYKTFQTQVVSDTIKANLHLRKRKKSKNKQKVERYVLGFHPDKDIKDYIPTDNSGNLNLTPNNLKTAENGFFYLKPLTTKVKNWDIKIITKPFELIDLYGKNINYVYPQIQPSNKITENFRMTKTVQQLDEVLLKKKKTKVYRDKFIKTLDSISLLEINEDYVCTDIEHRECTGGMMKSLLCDFYSVGVLNCTWHRNVSTRIRVIEGEVYTGLYSKKGRLIEPRSFDDPVTFRPYTFYFRKGKDITEEELLKKFNYKMIKGLYGKREFYQQVYDEVTINDGFLDARNTLFWKPDILTNEQGEATVEFYCSDINTKFIGVIEGAGGLGLLGTKNFEITVINKD